MGDIDILIESFEMKRIEAVFSNPGFKVEQKSPAMMPIVMRGRSRDSPYRNE